MCYTFAASAAFVTHLLQGPNCRVRVYAFTLSTLDLTELYFHSKPRCRKRCGAFLGNGWQSLQNTEFIKACIYLIFSYNTLDLRKAIQIWRERVHQ
jgi:hypothetical protein